MAVTGAVTNKGKRRFIAWLQGVSLPTNLYMALCTSAVAPTVDTNTFSELTEIATGNGYTAGGYSLSKNSTDFDVLTEDDTANTAYIEMKDITWTASGGTLPSSGAARYAILTDDNATQGNREILAYWDLDGDKVASSGNPFTLQGFRITAA